MRSRSGPAAVARARVVTAAQLEHAIMLRIKSLSLKNCGWRRGVALAPGALTPCSRLGPGTRYRVFAPHSATAKHDFVGRNV
jgi:hypothetical protein